MATKTTDTTEFKVEASRERSYGLIKQSFSYSQLFSTANGDTQLTAYRVVMAQLDMFFEDFEANELHKFKDVTANKQATNHETSDNWQKAFKFRRETKGNKTYYNVVTPRFPKFGVACWDECKGRAELIEKLGDKSEIDLDGYRVRVDENGKYPKAVEIDLLF